MYHLTKVQKELCNDVQSKLSRGAEDLVCEAKNCQDNGQESKSPDLNWCPPDPIAEKGSNQYPGTVTSPHVVTSI